MDESKRRIRLVYGHNGVDTYDRLFLERLASEFETYLLTFVPPTQVSKMTRVVQLRDFGRPLGIRRLNNFRITLGTLWRVLEFRRYVRWIRPQILVGNWVTTYGLYASMCSCRPFILFAYGSDIMVDPHRSLLHRWITMRVIRSADLVLVDSHVQRRAVLSLGCSPQKIILFPWVDLKDLTDTIPDPSFRDRLGWHDKIIVVSVRKHEPNYAVDTLIRAVPVALATAPNLRFLVFGSGTQTARLVRLAQELRVKKFVHFAGTVPRGNLLRYVKDCDIYASTSVTDGTSSSLVEAMSLGIPVVVTSIAGNVEWVADGVNGLMFNKGDSQALARAIVRLVVNRLESECMARRARKEIDERVKWELASKELINRMYCLCSKYAARQPNARRILRCCSQTLKQEGFPVR